MANVRGRVEVVGPPLGGGGFAQLPPSPQSPTGPPELLPLPEGLPLLLPELLREVDRRSRSLKYQGPHCARSRIHRTETAPIP